MNRRMKTILAVLTVVFGLSAGLSAQSTDEEWYLDKPIKEFTFSGLVTVKLDDLLPLVKSYVGKSFNVDPLLWEIEAKLFALDYFETIVPNALPGDETKTSVIVRFDVKERPSIQSIDLIGNRGLKNNEIMDKVLLKKGDLSNQTKLLSDIEAVRTLYIEKGYTEAKVNGRFETIEGKENTVRVVFDIVEGAPTTIKEIRFSGNAFVASSTLRGLMKTKAQFLFDSGVFQESKLEEDKAALIAYYTDHGYVDAKIERVTREMESKEGRNYLVLTIYISEGDQWGYAGLSFVGNQIFPTVRLDELVTQKPGKVFSLQKLTTDIGRVQDLYYESGYIFNTFERKETRDEAAKTIACTLVIGEFDKAHIESIIFKGNTRSKEYVLRRELPFEEGEVFNREKVIEGWRNLMNLQYFKGIQPETPVGSVPGLMNIVFNLEEQSTADINFGVTFSGDEDYPVTGMIKWNERNFLGRGLIVGVDLEASTGKQTIALTYTEPWMLGQRWSLGTSLSFTHTNLQNVLQDFMSPIFTDDEATWAAPDPYSTLQEYLDAVTDGETIGTSYLMKYDSYDFTWATTTGYRFKLPFAWLGVKSTYAPKIRYITYDNTLYRPYSVTERQNLNRWSFIDAISFSTYLDGRDIYYNPNNGYYVSQSVVYAGGALFGDRNYIRTDTALEGFLTLFKIPVTESWNFQLVLAAHSSLSLMLPNFSLTAGAWKTVTDTSDLLYIDGMNVGRGWKKLYGKALIDNKVELRMPIAEQVLWAVGFFDAAALLGDSADLANLSVNNFYFSFGAGIRFTIPQFPIRIYFCKGFQIKDGVVAWKTGDLDFGNDFSMSFVIALGGDTF